MRNKGGLRTDPWDTPDTPTSEVALQPANSGVMYIITCKLSY